MTAEEIVARALRGEIDAKQATELIEEYAEQERKKAFELGASVQHKVLHEYNVDCGMDGFEHLNCEKYEDHK